ncbi:hypothetical protein ACFV4N_39140 [Actinosynnema sp. NPDC059797]
MAAHHAAGHLVAVAGLVLVDGANPVPEPLVTEADLPEFRAMAEELRRGFERTGGTARQVSLTPRDFVGLNLEVEVVRSGVLDRYREVDLPIHMIMLRTRTRGRTGWTKLERV